MELIQQLAAAGTVTLLLAATLWALRRRGWAQLALPGKRPARRLRAVERLPLGPQHTLHLVRFDGRALLVSSSPSGCALLDASAWRESDDGPEAAE